MSHTVANPPTARPFARQILSLSLAFGALVATSTHVLAQSGLTNDAPDRRLEEIREMVLYARYRDAIAALRGHLDSPRLSAAARNAGLELLAIAQLATNATADADQTLQLLYARDPGHRLSDPDASPRIASAFARARESSPQPLEVSLWHEPTLISSRRSPEVHVRLGEGADAVQELRLNYRDEQGRLVRVGMHIGEELEGQVSLPLRDGDEEYTVEYFIEARAPSGVVLARAGSVDEPLELKVPAEPPPATQTAQELIYPVAGEQMDEPALTSRPWFWAVVGGAVVVVAVAIVLAVTLSGGDEDVPQGTLGSARLGLFSF